MGTDNTEKARIKLWGKFQQSSSKLKRQTGTDVHRFTTRASLFPFSKRSRGLLKVGGASWGQHFAHINNGGFIRHWHTIQRRLVNADSSVSLLGETSRMTWTMISNFWIICSTLAIFMFSVRDIMTFFFPPWERESHASLRKRTSISPLK